MGGTKVPIASITVLRAGSLYAGGGANPVASTVDLLPTIATDTTTATTATSKSLKASSNSCGSNGASVENSNHRNSGSRWLKNKLQKSKAKTEGGFGDEIHKGESKEKPEQQQLQKQRQRALTEVTYIKELELAVS